MKPPHWISTRVHGSRTLSLVILNMHWPEEDGVAGWRWQTISDDAVTEPLTAVEEHYVPFITLLPLVPLLHSQTPSVAAVTESL